ncbi:MAG: peptidase M48 Ste24p [Desulfobulbus propionicus]|nr:MAG: peptidase M48 Ste24p [Desulfobulbus propionicus]
MKRFFCAVLLLTLSACATSPTGRSQLMLISPEMAIEMSNEAYVQTLAPLQKNGKVDADIKEVARVREITGRIIAQAIVLFPDSQEWEWSVKVIDDPETVNAWCMAGGKMAIYTGLLEEIAPTDDELAQVMGHEISHALANHTAERMSVALATQAGLLGVSLAAGDSEYAGLAVSGSALAATLALSLPNSRTAESEADAMGIELAARAGYNPQAAVTLWEKMEKNSDGGRLEFLSTHPSPANRQEKLRQLATEVMPYYQQNIARPVYPLK